MFKSLFPMYNYAMSKNNIEMFKSYDIRTKESNLTNKIKSNLAEAISIYIKENLKVKSVVICRDARLYVPALLEIVLDKLVQSGLDVFLNPLPISTCQFYYTCMQHRKSAGLMFTASHNPGEYVGIKLVAQDLVPISLESGPEGGLLTIKKLYEKGAKIKASIKPGKTVVINEQENYINYSMNLAGVSEGSLKGVNILFEFLNGSAGIEEALAFQKAGANVTLRHIVPNGLFPCGDPNPIIESSIAPARKTMKNGNFDLGFCFDGDGDRMDIMDSTGAQIVPSHNMSIIAPRIKKEIFGNKKSNIYVDLKALPSSIAEITQTGVTPHICRNGHSFIKAKLKENLKNGYFAAVEESAHYYICMPYDLNKQNRKNTDYAVAESTLFYALLTAKSYKENPEKYKPIKAIDQKVFRAREWSIHVDKGPQAMKKLIGEVNKEMLKRGANIITKMDDGTSLDASLIQYNLPVEKGKNWFQIVIRVSRSEDSLVRCEISSNSKKLCAELKDSINYISSMCI